MDRGLQVGEVALYDHLRQCPEFAARQEQHRQRELEAVGWQTCLRTANLPPGPDLDGWLLAWREKYKPRDVREVLSSLTGLRSALQARQPHSGLTVHGTYGVGKTECVLAYCRGLLKDGVELRVEHVPTLQLRVWECLDKSAYWLDRLSGFQLLVLDDFGLEMPAVNWVDGFLYPLLWDRLLRRVPTLLTTSLSPAELAGRYTGVTSRTGAKSVSWEPLLDRLTNLLPWTPFHGASKRGA